MHHHLFSGIKDKNPKSNFILKPLELQPPAANRKMIVHGKQWPAAWGER